MTSALRDFDPDLVVATDETRTRLVHAISRLVRAESYHAVGVMAICDLAGVHRGSFYHHFDSKQSLMIEALDRAWEDFDRRALASCRDPEMEPKARIDALVDFIHGCLVRDKADTGRIRGSMFGNLAAESTAFEEPIGRRLAALFADWSATVEIPLAVAQDRGEIDQDASLHDLAVDTVATLEGLILLAKVENEPDLLFRGGRSLTARLWCLDRDVPVESRHGGVRHVRDS
jgi:TetR/AcrR family transcriptional repressor of nem operon